MRTAFGRRFLDRILTMLDDACARSKLTNANATRRVRSMHAVQCGAEVLHLSIVPTVVFVEGANLRLPVRRLVVTASNRTRARARRVFLRSKFRKLTGQSRG